MVRAKVNRPGYVGVTRIVTPKPIFVASAKMGRFAPREPPAALEAKCRLAAGLGRPSHQNGGQPGNPSTFAKATVDQAGGGRFGFWLRLAQFGFPSLRQSEAQR